MSTAHYTHKPIMFQRKEKPPCTTCHRPAPPIADGAYLEGFREFLAQAAAAGERAKPNPGAGADASGQPHLWRDFGGMKTKQRIALIKEMQQVCLWGDRGVCVGVWCCLEPRRVVCFGRGERGPGVRDKCGCVTVRM